MKNNLKDVNTLTDLYYKKVFLKEENNNNESSIEEIVNALKGEKEKIQKTAEELLPSIEDALEKGNPEELSQLNSEEIKESYISEGIGSRIRSNISGAKRFAFGERTPTGDTNIQSHRVNKRFEILRDKIGKHLKELERDLGVSSDYDQSVKQEIQKMISRLDSKEFGNITPKQSKLGDIRHKIGRGVEWAGKAVGLGAIGALLGGGIAAAAGASGIAAAVIQGAVIGAVRKAGADIINGKKPSAKQVATQAAIVAALGGIVNLPVSQEFISKNIDAISNALFGSEEGLTLPDEYAGVEDSDVMPSSDSIESDSDFVGGEKAGLKPEDYFEKYHNTPFDPLSELDKSKLEFDKILFDNNLKGLDEWSDGPSPAIVNAASEANLDSDDYAKLTKEIKNISPDQMNNFKANFKANPEKYAKAFIQTLLKR
jgi:hypothetical protein